VPAAARLLDTSMLSGLAFVCQPDCGLCCFATPRTGPEERARLVQIDPSIPFLPMGGGADRIADRGDGGACYLLEKRRCRAHPARPFPCREFPLSTHIADRVQVTAVLSCPGIDLSGFLDWADGRPPRRRPVGFGPELDAVRARFEPGEVDRSLSQAQRRFRSGVARLQRKGLWEEPKAIREALRPELLGLVRDAFPPEDPPEREDGIASLPLFRDPRLGVVAIAKHPGGWGFLSLSERGEEPTSLNVLPPPTRCPEMAAGGERALQAYLEYLLWRDLTYWQAAYHVDPDGEDGLLEEVAWDLADVGALVLSRAVTRQRLRGVDPGPLDAESVLDGVRASDAEFIDRPTLGLRF
jgi:hypothetical protein